MNDTKRAVLERVPVILDLIVSKASGFKLRIENVQCTAIDARRDSMEPVTTKEEETAGLLAALHIVQQLDTLVDELETLAEEILDLLTLTQPSNLQ